MDPRDSGIFRLASVGSYLDALSTITQEMSLKERSNLIFLDRCLHERWGREEPSSSIGARPAKALPS